MTLDQKITVIRNDLMVPPVKITDFQKKRKTFFRKFKQDRRKHRRDRRKSVRDGVIVNLSFMPNRRKEANRRSVQTKTVDFQERRKTVSRKFKRDRRKHRRDRRKGVRDGVIVTLSSRPNRRKVTNRRALQTKF